MGGGAQAAGRGAGRVLPAWATAQGSGDKHPAEAADASVQHAQGQFDDADQGGRGGGSDRGQFDDAEQGGHHGQQEEGGAGETKGKKKKNNKSATGKQARAAKNAAKYGRAPGGS
jgi:hypothetical protein